MWCGEVWCSVVYSVLWFECVVCVRLCVYVCVVCVRLCVCMLVCVCVVFSYVLDGHSNGRFCINYDFVCIVDSEVLC